MVTSHPLEVLKVIEIYLQIVPTDFYFKCILVFGLHTNVYVAGGQVSKVLESAEQNKSISK